MGQTLHLALETAEAGNREGQAGTGLQTGALRTDKAVLTRTRAVGKRGGGADH